MATTSSLEAGRNVAQTLTMAGFQAYFVGGCVRDLLLKLTPKDFDLATNAHPEQVLALCPGASLVGASFGVVIVKVPMGDEIHQIEVATYRNDGTYTDGRRPDEVQFVSNVQEDVSRRDFTINALLMDPVTNTIVDYVDGQKDLENRVIRTVGDPETRFSEDRLRILRAIRFATKLNFVIEPGTLRAMTRQAIYVDSLSAERRREEMNKILMTDNPALGLALLTSTKVLRHVSRSFDLKKIGIQLQLLGSVVPSDNLNFRWACLFDGLGPWCTGNFLKDLKFSNDEVKTVEYLCNTRQVAEFSQKPPCEQRRMVREPLFTDLERLARLKAAADLFPSYEVRNWKKSMEDLVKIKAMPWPERLLTGEDLIKHGYQPGPMFKRMLDHANDGILNNEIHSIAGAVKSIREHFVDERWMKPNGLWNDDSKPTRFCAPCKECSAFMSFNDSLVATIENRQIIVSEERSNAPSDFVNCENVSYCYVVCSGCRTRRNKSSFEPMKVSD